MVTAALLVGAGGATFIGRGDKGDVRGVGVREKAVIELRTVDGFVERLWMELKLGRERQRETLTIAAERLAGFSVHGDGGCATAV